MRRHFAFGLVLLAMGACSELPPTGPAASADPTAAPDPERAASLAPAGATYRVTVTNLTSTQAFTPPLVAAHRPPVSVFRVGQPAGVGLKEIAENGNLVPLHTALENHRHVAEVVVNAGDPPPLLPGEVRSFDVHAERGATQVSWVSMLICTNDGFTGVSGERLPLRPGQTETWYTAAYDAGTEINTEDAHDLVPPCGVLSGIHDGSVGTGASDPALAEGGVVHHHAGIGGGADLTEELHGWTNPVARIQVTRLR